MTEQESNDRELLEFAAKAAGIVGIYIGGDFSKQWNPLTDNGDALRLAVKLKMDISRGIRGDGGVVVAERGATYWVEPLGRDELAATRRAIVRAAAETGKGK